MTEPTIINTVLQMLGFGIYKGVIYTFIPEVNFEMYGRTMKCKSFLESPKEIV